MPGRGRTWREGGLPDSTVTSDELKDLTILTADIASGAVIGTKLGFFKSPPIPMSGAPIPIPHGLGRVPSKVTLTILDDHPCNQPTIITYEDHTATDVIV